jgi:hypothetical protein
VYLVPSVARCESNKSDVRKGAGTAMKCCVLVAIPEGVWTVILPELTTAGVNALMLVAVADSTFSVVGPILTMSLAPFVKKFVRVIVRGTR